jgi:hypothetical protein
VPTYDILEFFWRDFDRLSPAEQREFLAAVRKFLADLRRGKLRAGLRVKGIKGARGIYEMTWAADGRATFQYGDPVREGEPHIVWRRIGKHDIFDAP